MIVHEREWFVLQGPQDGEGERRYFVLSKDGAHPVCSLYPGDAVLIGRAKRR